jgi:hypothetical protein
MQQKHFRGAGQFGSPSKLQSGVDFLVGLHISSIELPESPEHSSHRKVKTSHIKG